MLEAYGTGIGNDNGNMQNTLECQGINQITITVAEENTEEIGQELYHALAFLMGSDNICFR